MGKAQSVLVLFCYLLISVSALEVSVSLNGRGSRRMKEKVIGSEESVEGKADELPSCQLATWEDHLVVAARYEEDISWMAVGLNPWLPFLVFSVNGDKNATHVTASNMGREAQAYLQFIVTYYSCLPKFTVFLHAHQFSPHSQDIVSDLKRLRWDNMPGFFSMSRPNIMNTFVFSDPDSHKPDPKDTFVTAHWSQFAYDQLVSLASTWPLLFQEELGDPPGELSTPAAGQFVVAREQILAHPLAFYEGLLKWLHSDPMDSYWAGLVFEQTWSYIFGAGPAYHHPEECDVFLCNGDGEAVVPDWRLVMHQKHRPIYSLRHQS